MRLAFSSLAALGVSLCGKERGSEGRKKKKEKPVLRVSLRGLMQHIYIIILCFIAFILEQLGLGPDIHLTLDFEGVRVIRESLVLTSKLSPEINLQ